METGLGIKDPLIVETPIGESGIIPSFREQVFGAGSSIAKFNDDGFFMGATNFADAPFKVTYAGSVTASDLTLIGGTIKAGQTAYNTGTGYWLGTVSGTPKFSIGNGSTKYLTWDGTALTIRGTLNADDITVGTLVGRTVKASGGAGTDVWIDSSLGELSFYYGGVKKGQMFCSSGGNILIESVNDVLITASSRTYITANGLISLNANYDGGTDQISFASNSVQIAYISSTGTFVNSGNIQCGGTFKSSDGTSGLTHTGWGYISSLRWNGGTLEAKVSVQVMKDGLVTGISEGNWYAV